MTTAAALDRLSARGWATNPVTGIATRTDGEFTFRLARGTTAWIAGIRVRGVEIACGTYDTPAHAIEAMTDNAWALAALLTKDDR